MSRFNEVMEGASSDARRPEYSASWRVHSEALALAELRDALGEPSAGHSRGDLVSPGRSDARRRDSFWSLSSGLPRTDPLEAHIEVLLGEAESRRPALDALRQEVRTDFFCGVFRHDQWAPVASAETIVFGCGFVLAPGVLRRLADLDIPFSCDVY